MPFVETRTQFPSFQRSKDFFKSGLGSPPQVQISGPAGTPVGQPGGAQAPQTAPAATPVQQPSPAATPSPSQQVQPPTGQIPLGYQQTGAIEERLFQPIQQATQAGQQQLTQFADLFRQQAGPSRTYESIGAQGTLAKAVEGGPIQPAQQLVGAQYQGPYGIDPAGAGNLMDLAGRLRGRQQALGTGGGISQTLIQSAPGTTGGEARFTAQDLLTPEYRARLAQATAGVDPFAQRLEGEILGSQAFAQQRAQEESDIARQAREYLTGRRAGITTDIESEMARQLERQKQATDLYQQALRGESPQSIAEALRQAQAAGFLSPEADVGAFNTQLQQALQASPGLQQQILADPRFAAIKNVPLAELGIDKKGRQTYLIDGKDFRQVLGKGEEAQLFKARQAALEEAFSPVRGVRMPSGTRATGDYGFSPELQQLASPLYFGGDVELPEIRNFLDFDPGVRPSRGNVSTEEQRTHFNRINQILGDLDRISETTTPFKAAVIMANVDQYLAAEEEALEAQKETLDQSQKEWFRQVKKARKSVRKAERKKDYGKIGSVIGGVLGAGIGTVIGGPIGGVSGYGIGSGLGQSAGEGLA